MMAPVKSDAQQMGVASYRHQRLSSGHPNLQRLVYIEQRAQRA